MQNEESITVLQALVVDDEPLARADLQELLTEHRNVRLAAEAGSLREAVEVLKRFRTGAGRSFDVVFLDIQLRGGDGFDLLPHLHPDTDVIFVTAHDKYAIRAFEVNALDYLLKPVSPERLARALERLRSGKPQQAGDDTKAMPTLLLGDSVLVRTDGSRHFVAVDGICAITSVGGNYTELYTTKGRLLARGTVKQWEARLPEMSFVRIHRATIVNAARVAEIRIQAGQSIVRVQGHEKDFSASRRMVPRLNALLLRGA